MSDFPSSPTTIRLTEIGVVGARVALPDIGAPDGPPVSYAVVGDEVPRLALTAPVFLNRPDFASVFPAETVARHGKVVCSIRNAFLFGPFGAVAFPDGTAVRESVLHTDAQAWSFTYQQFKGQFPGRHVMWRAADDTMLSFNSYSSNNYFHFLIDCLGQAHWRQRLPHVARAPMILTGYDSEAAKVLPFMGEALTRVGYDARDLAPFDGTLMLCRHVVFPARDTGANPAKVAFLRNALAVPENKGNRRLYITRPGATRRRVNNDAAVAARLERRGFTIIDPGALGIDAQIAAFSEASVVVGPHGAGLTNAIFMPPGGALVELTHEARVVWTFHEIAAANRLAYACVVGQRESENDNPLYANFAVDPDAVDAAVDAALAVLR